MTANLGAVPHGDFVPTTFKVSDFLDWQRAGTLNLHPPFQRRSVWKRGAKSYLIDTVVRRLPVPLIFLQERTDLVTKTTVRDVVDGQQRLRTLISFVDPAALGDFAPSSDQFTVSRIHNREIAGRTFGELADRHKSAILSYRFSVQVLPETLTDRDILEVFARLNSTGQKLTPQELRNAAYFGACKTLMYALAHEQTDRWLEWQIYSPDELARMKEVEMTSDLCYNIVHGLSAKSQSRLDRFYGQFDEEFEYSDIVAKQFRTTMDAIDHSLGRNLAGTVFSSEVHFFTLFAAVYDLLYGLEDPLEAKPARRMPPGFRAAAIEVSRRFREWEVPTEVLDAVSRASADYGRRATRLKFLLDAIKR